MKEQIVYIKVKDLKNNPDNPRKNDSAVESVAKSIERYGFRNPLIVDDKNIVWCGNTRLKASVKLGLEEVPCIVIKDLTEKQMAELALLDNKTNEIAEWDYDLLSEQLPDLDLEEFDLDWGIAEEKEYDVVEHNKLQDRFVVPPFSILDTRQGYWQDRKREWLQLTGNLSETRNDGFGQLGGSHNILEKINEGTSNFDPVLAEIVYKWFNVENGKILDPFGGEQTKGVVAGELGYRYEAVEIRKDQVDLDNEKTKKYKGVKYICGDSNKISSLIKGEDFDLCFTSPPYYDLEVYSKEDMSALGTYEEFMEQYKNIFKQCYDKLKDNRFLVVKVGEIRNKKTGEYRCFVADNIKLMTDIGFKFYNDLVLINAIGTATIRANRSMNNRKVVHLHQNVLVFYKGDIKKIKEEFPVIKFEEGVLNGEQI